MPLPVSPVPRAVAGLLLLLAAPAWATPLTPGAVGGTAQELCVDGAGVVVSDQTVDWEMEWRFIDRWLYYGSSTWYNNGTEIYVYDFVYTGIDAVWRFGSGTELEMSDAMVTSRVSTLSMSPGDSMSLAHSGEAVGEDGALTGGWSASGSDWTGTGFTEDARTTLDPDTLTDTSLSITYETPDLTCTWEGDIDSWVPVEECSGGLDEDGDGLVDGDDPNCQACGDGVVDAHEECDDGNRYAGDLCDEECRVEPDADGDGVNDADDRCAGEDDTVDVDSDMRPDCLPPIGGGVAAGTAESSCENRATGEVTTETVDWEVTWDVTTGIDFYYYDHGGVDTVYDWGQLWSVDATWTVGSRVVDFTEGELYGANYDGPDGDWDYFFLAHNETSGETLRIVDIQVTEGDFLVGDVSAADFRVDLTRAVSALFSWYEENPDEVCRIYGEFTSFGDQGPDGDGIPDGWDLCPDENATGWDLDLDGCLDDSDGDGVTDDQDVCPVGDDVDDLDGDLTPDACDVCPAAAENDQDGDGLCPGEDACPLDADDGSGGDDLDADGVCNSDDVCNSGTGDWLGDSEDDLLDRDVDGVPDGCDLCVDANGDEVCTSDDACFFAGLGGDADVDGVCDDEDPCPVDYLDDADGDGVCDSEDVCAGADDLAESDGDGVVDCLDNCPWDVENDADGDGVCEGADNCDVTYNPDQLDSEGDGLGDACDPEVDADDDGVEDDSDACPDTPAGEVVLGDGCSVAQTCPPDRPWRRHSSYVRCVSAAAEELWASGTITRAEMNRIKREALLSDIGR